MSVYVYIFILCFNESVLLPHTIKHYKKYLPNSKIIILDNNSTDNSRSIAKSLGCSIIPFSTSNELNEITQTHLKNNIWKAVKRGWIIMADMDEWLCITENELVNETMMGTTILRIKGYNIIGNSKNVLLNDIDLHSLNKGNPFHLESKSLCFRRQNIKAMNYSSGAHKCNPIGRIIYSKKEYINKHMLYLGLPFIVRKNINRYNRTHKMRQMGMGIHYSNNIIKIKNEFLHNLKRARIIDNLQKYNNQFIENKNTENGYNITEYANKNNEYEYNIMEYTNKIEENTDNNMEQNIKMIITELS